MSQEFVIDIDKGLFQSTNAAWNSLRLNDPWSVGYVTTLIELRNFERKEAWEALYYNSGVYRNKLIHQDYREISSLLNDSLLPLNDVDSYAKLDKVVKAINNQHGRTPGQLAEKGEILFDFMRKNGSSISLEDCAKAVRFRTICETWNGVIVRERNTVTNLKKRFPKVEFRKTDGQFDHQYAVDYEVFKSDRLKCGLQIKPKSYTFNTSYVLKAKKANLRKNDQYKSTYGAKVFDVISKSNGEIENPEVINHLKQLLQ